MTADRSVQVLTLALATLSLLLGGCSRSGASVTEAATIAPVTTPPGLSLSISPTMSPTMTPSIPPSTEPAPVGSPLSGSSAPEPTPPEPPSASISIEGGDPVIGELGSYSWDNSGSAAPWLPGNPIHVGAGERLTLVLSRRVGVTNWSASRQTPGASLGGDGATGMAEGSGQPIAFLAPPSGSWSVLVSVGFADNRGSAAYYWLIDVD